MADNVSDITFANVIISDLTNNATVTGTITVDYTTNTVTNSTLATATGGGLVSFATPGATFSVLPLNAPLAGQHLVQGSAIIGGITSTIAFSYTGSSPTTLDAMQLVLPTAGFALDTAAGATIAPNSVTSVFVCFLRGTLIRTPKGDVPVESLKAGDLVTTTSGENRPVKWIGHRDFDLRGRLDRRRFYPVRIAAGAFGPNRPSQDLKVSAGHSICVDLCGEVMVQAGHLINGATIALSAADEVSYWHVELDSHDVLIANNLPAESYLAMENRGFFEEAGARVEVLDPGVGRTHSDFCRPVVLDGPLLELLRSRLNERAEAAGWSPSRDVDFRLVVDGQEIRPLEEGNAAVFWFPAAARDVRLVSNTFIPAKTSPCDDWRALGACLLGLSLCGSEGERRSVSLDNERLKSALHPEEAAAGARWRWTKGELSLSAELWSGLTGPIALFVTYESGAVRNWTAPADAAVEESLHKGKPNLRAVA